MYLAAVLDWHSRYVLSWELSNTLDSSFCVAALEAALAQGRPEIFNTDQGAQFTSRAPAAGAAGVLAARAHLVTPALSLAACAHVVASPFSTSPT